MTTPDPNDLPSEWTDLSRNQLVEDLNFLRESGLIEVTGINDDGEWLYALTPKARQVLDEDESGDPWAVISELIAKAEEENNDE